MPSLFSSIRLCTTQTVATPTVDAPEEAVQTDSVDVEAAQPTADSLQQTTLYAGNLAWDIDNAGLLEIFSEYNPTGTNVVTMKNGMSRGFGFVEFESAEDAQKAKDSLHGQDVRGRSIFVGDKHTNRERQGQQKNPARRVFMGNLSFDANVLTLEDLCGKFGTVINAKIVSDRDSGVSKGYGFVTMSTEEEAKAVIEALNASEVDGRQLIVDSARTGSANKKPASKTRMLYVGNLSWRMDLVDLRDICSKFGTVSNARLITDRDSGMSKGYGFVTMSTEEEAQAVIEQLNEASVDGRMLNVAIAGAPKADVASA